MKLVYFSPVPWRSFRQRPHWMVASLLRAGAVDRVLWVEPYATRLPTRGDLRRPPRMAETADPGDTRVDTLRVRAMPFEPLALGRSINRSVFQRTALQRLRDWLGRSRFVVGVGKPSPLALAALELGGGQAGYRGSFADAMDRYSAFYAGRSRTAMQDWERAVAERVDWMQVSSTGLAARYRAWCGEVHVALNGCDPASIRAAVRQRSEAPPPAPIFGYFGTLARWFDWAWLERFAGVLQREYPQAVVELIGPLYSAAPRHLPPAVHRRGALKNSATLAQAASWEAGLIPFVRDELTADVDPVKYYEYRALGCAVVATAFGELTDRSDPGLYLADDEAAMAAAIGAVRRREVAARLDPEWCWDARFAPLAEWIGAAAHGARAR